MLCTIHNLKNLGKGNLPEQKIDIRLQGFFISFFTPSAKSDFMYHCFPGDLLFWGFPMTGKVPASSVKMI